jgi:hypothetical protein
MKKSLLSACFFALFVVHATALHATIVLGFQPSLVDTVKPGGNPVQVDVVISGLGNGAAPSLGAFDLFIAFNPAAVSFTRTAFGDPIHGDQLSLASGSLTQVERLPSAIRLAEVSLDDPGTLDSAQLGAFTLATLDFVTGAFPAISDLVIVNDNVRPALLVDAVGAPISDFRITSGRINTTPVPSTLLLLSLGLAALAAMRAARSSPSLRTSRAQLR